MHHHATTNHHITRITHHHDSSHPHICHAPSCVTHPHVTNNTSLPHALCLFLFLLTMLYRKINLQPLGAQVLFQSAVLLASQELLRCAPKPSAEPPWKRPDIEDPAKSGVRHPSTWSTRRERDYQSDRVYHLAMEKLKKMKREQFDRPPFRITQETGGSWRQPLARAVEQEALALLINTSFRGRKLRPEGLFHLWGAFVKGQPLADLPLNLWSEECAPTPPAPPLLRAPDYWRFMTQPTEQHRTGEVRVPLAPQPGWGPQFVLLDQSGVATSTIRGLQAFTAQATHCLTDPKWFRNCRPMLAANSAARLALEIALVIVEQCHNTTRLGPSEHGSVRLARCYLPQPSGTASQWSATNISSTKEQRSFASGIINAFFSFDSFFGVKTVRRDLGHPCIQFNGHSVHTVFRTGHHGAAVQGAGRGDEASDVPIRLPPTVALVGIDVNNGSLAVGALAPSMQDDVECKLLDMPVKHKYLPNRHDGKGMHWITAATQKVQLRTHAHERERAAEKATLDSVLQPGGLGGLERALKDPAQCQNNTELLGALTAQFSYELFARFLYCSHQALHRERDRQIRESRSGRAG